MGQEGDWQTHSTVTRVAGLMSTKTTAASCLNKLCSVRESRAFHGKDFSLDVALPYLLREKGVFTMVPLKLLSDLNT